MDEQQPAALPRRANLVVPGDYSTRVAGAGRFGAAQVVFDLADVDPSRKDVARAEVADALESNDYGDALVAVRVNPIDSMWAYRDIVDVVERAGEFLDGIVVPQVRSPSDIEFVDTLVSMIERRIDLGHRIDIQAEIATAQALALLDEIALASDRLDALVLDEAGVLSALGAGDGAMTTQDDVLASLRLQMLVTARAVGLDAVVAPAVDGDDEAAYRATIGRAQALGYDGARCTHPTQVTLANEVFGSG
jgi:citrate lyase subunit beta/citryl-CoA lyase